MTCFLLKKINKYLNNLRKVSLSRFKSTSNNKDNISRNEESFPANATTH